MRSCEWGGAGEESEGESGEASGLEARPAAAVAAAGSNNSSSLTARPLRLRSRSKTERFCSEDKAAYVCGDGEDEDDGRTAHAAAEEDAAEAEAEAEAQEGGGSERAPADDSVGGAIASADDASEFAADNASTGDSVCECGPPAPAASSTASGNLRFLCPTSSARPDPAEGTAAELEDDTEARFRRESDVAREEAGGSGGVAGAAAGAGAGPDEEGTGDVDTEAALTGEDGTEAMSNSRAALEARCDFEPRLCASLASGTGGTGEEDLWVFGGSTAAVAAPGGADSPRVPPRAAVRTALAPETPGVCGAPPVEGAADAPAAPPSAWDLRRLLGRGVRGGDSDRSSFLEPRPRALIAGSGAEQCTRVLLLSDANFSQAKDATQIHTGVRFWRANWRRGQKKLLKLLFF